MSTGESWKTGLADLLGYSVLRLKEVLKGVALSSEEFHLQPHEPKHERFESVVIAIDG